MVKKLVDVKTLVLLEKNYKDRDAWKDAMYKYQLKDWKPSLTLWSSPGNGFCILYRRIEVDV